jgi:hypothetical protein
LTLPGLRHYILNVRKIAQETHMDNPISSDTGMAVASRGTNSIRTDVVGNRVTVPELAVAFGKSTRTIQSIIKTKGVPYLQVGNTRYVDPADFRRALEE